MGISPASSTGFSPPLELTVPPARAVRITLCLFHCAAVLPALLLELHWSLRALWLLGVFGAAVLSIRGNGIERVRLGRDGWQLIAAGQAEEAVLIGWFVQPWLCVLRFQGARRVYTVVLTPTPELAVEQRRLRALLNLGIQPRSRG